VGGAGVARREETEAPSHGGAGVDGELAGASSLGVSAAEGGVARNVGRTGGPGMGGGRVACGMCNGGAAVVRG
jgi:hypothetical protein